MKATGNYVLVKKVDQEVTRESGFKIPGGLSKYGPGWQEWEVVSIGHKVDNPDITAGTHVLTYRGVETEILNESAEKLGLIKDGEIIVIL